MVRIYLQLMLEVSSTLHNAVCSRCIDLTIYKIILYHIAENYIIDAALYKIRTVIKALAYSVPAYQTVNPANGDSQEELYSELRIWMHLSCCQNRQH